MEQNLISQFAQILKPEQIWEQESMSAHTTFRVGGNAELLVTPQVEQVAEVIAICKETQTPYLVIGNGSNLLVGDQGIEGVVIELGKQAEEISIEGVCVTAQAGALLSKIAAKALQDSLTGMEFAAGIPGTIGGAVVMNAGAYGGEMKDILMSVTVLDTEGHTRELSVDELELAYRHSCIPENGYIVLSVKLKLRHGEKAQIRAQMDDLREKRTSKQPLEYPSAGSTFKRPEGYFAGKLIEDAGLKGYTVGGAQVSEKHSGFVINKGGATAADIRQLMEDVQRIVYEKYQVEMKPEVRFVGEF